MTSSRRVYLAVLLLTLAACHPDFKIGTYTTNEALYKAGMVEFQAGRYENAVSVFEKLTNDLPARDPVTFGDTHLFQATAILGCNIDALCLKAAIAPGKTDRHIDGRFMQPGEISAAANHHGGDKSDERFRWGR